MTHSTHTAVQIPDEAVKVALDALAELASTPMSIPLEDWSRISSTIMTALNSLPHLSAPCAVEVKKLTWHFRGGNYPDWRASDLDFKAVIDKSLAICYGDFPLFINGRWDGVKHVSIEEAKAAAQADFERRILSCVVTKPVDVEAVREALEFYADTSKYPAPLTGGMGDLWSDCDQIARAALNVEVSNDKK